MVRTIWEIKDKEESFIKALGLITSRYALLEELIMGCINIMIGGEYASIVTAGVPFSRLLTILGALYRQKHKLTQSEEYPTPLIELFTLAEKAEEERNKVIHSMWQSSYIKDILVRTKRSINRKKGLRVEHEEVHTQDLNKVADIIQRAVETVLNFTNDVLAGYIATPLSPLDGAILNNKPEFVWLKVEGATAYKLEISERADFLARNLIQNGDNIVKDTKYACKLYLKRNFTYYWRVSPIISTETGYWSQISSFTIR